MRVGFFHVDRGDTPHRQLAASLIASIRRTMPGVAVAHLTDETTESIVGAEIVVRRAGPAQIALACLDAYAAIDGEWLFVDTDVIVQQDVRSIFERPFDIAVATREGTLREKEIGTKFMASMPFNKGAVFSRSPAFWRSAYDRLQLMSAGRQAWMGDQDAMCQVIAAGAFRVEILPNAYNYPPKSQNEDLTEKAVLHFKGPRKAWMPRVA